ncbi:MAG: T9SS type A sorting domain-containing protein, partial [Ignavibacteria bacterium]|nr:T9SS type A sorting domain-containing protein [Ignavibacteria bacterium]
VVLIAFFSLVSSKPVEVEVAEGEYIVIAWNDLGMHCSNKDFSTMAVLPPYNNLKAQVVKRGAGGIYPEIITSGVKVTYEIPGNTYSVGKTNFWDFAFKLFNVTLAPNVGLKGAGLSGEMTLDAASGDHYKVEGIPVTPYTDADLTNEDPYQLALVKVYDMDGKLLATTRPVIPVSNEISCVSSGCHNSEQEILNSHPKEGGFNASNKPILCASCHASNALGTIGSKEAGAFSMRIHSKHSEKTNDCYKCHPGPKTKCFRDVMFSKGKVCSDCHGTMSQIASSIEQGRRPWLDEPSCDKPGCHAVKFAVNVGKLYRESRGHGGMFCSACHGSPHAIYTSTNPRDNQQMVDLQGHSGKLKECWVCHGLTPLGNGPHGYRPVSVNDEKENNGIEIYPNPVSDFIYILYPDSHSKIEIFSFNGNKMKIGNPKYNADFTEAKFNISELPKGIYIIKIGLRTAKFVKL